MTAFTNGALEIEIVFPFIETSFKEDGGKLFWNTSIVYAVLFSMSDRNFK